MSFNRPYEGLKVVDLSQGLADPWPVPNIPGMPEFTVGDVLSRSPKMGLHTRSILGELGFSEPEIDRLYQDEVVA